MDPIATHTERHLQVRRTFELYADRVVVHAHWLVKGRRQNTVKLADLTPDYKRLVIRNRWFRRACWILTAGMLLTAYAIHNQQTRSPAMYAGSVCMGLGIVMAALTYRKVLFIRFTKVDGRPALDIARTGAAESFDQFIRQLQRQIRKQ